MTIFTNKMTTNCYNDLDHLEHTEASMGGILNIEEIRWGRVACIGFFWFMLGTSGRLL